MTKTKQIILIPVLGALMLAGGGVAGYAGLAAAQSADEGEAPTERGMFDSKPHVGGEITAVSGTVLTVSDKRKGGTYSIETSGATFEKDGAASSLAAFAVGDHVMAVGTLSDTTLTATKVMGGMPRGGVGHGKGHGVHGTVTAVDGSTITVTGKDGESYTVNAGSATVQKMTTGALSDIVVGDTIGVHGTVSGTSVTAERIMDDLPQPPTQN